MTMRWRKRGVVYCPAGNRPWARTNAMIPTPVRIAPDRLRVYITCCDELGIGRPGWVDLDASDPMRVVEVGADACMDIGRPGTFDENGVLACSVVDDGQGRYFMYYVGFELGTRIRYRLLSGLAISTDGGRTFARLKETPILERSPGELFFRGGPFVLRAAGGFRMWYVSGSTWTMLNGKSMPEYVVRYLESRDGMSWGEAGHLCIDVAHADEHGFGRPWVVVDPSGLHEMYYSIRRRSLSAYRLGHATSPDGRTWTRDDPALGLDVSGEGFDSKAIMYSAVIEVDGRTYCFYNGDDFGRLGFGLAERESR